MANIRKQSIKGTIWVYFGFSIGALITYLLTHKTWFTLEEYGLTRTLLELGILFSAFSLLGSNFYIYKLFPYYKDNLENKNNDLLGTALKIAAVGFTITSLFLLLLKPIIIKKFGTNSPLLVDYFYLIIPIGFSYLIIYILESFAFAFNKAVTISFLKEVLLRFYTLFVIVLKITSVINLDTFIYLFAAQYLIVAVSLIYILKKENNLWLNFKTSHVTKKYRKNIINILLLTSLTMVVSVLRLSMDVLVLAAKRNLDNVAILGFAAYLAIVMQAPMRTLNGVTIPILSRCWKDKNYQEINRIYKRTSINMLAFALFIFFIVMLNYDAAVHFFDLNPSYLLGKNVFIILGIVNIIELGTGVNGQIIGTSSFFRFELWTSILLTALIIPLSYFLTDKYGVIGPAIANLASFTIYNTIRYIFLLKKFNMQPFSSKTVELIFISLIAGGIVYYLFDGKEGLLFLILRSVIFFILFAVPVYLRNISPDVKQVIETIKRRSLP